MNDKKWELCLHNSVKENIEDMDAPIQKSTGQGLAEKPMIELIDEPGWVTIDVEHETPCPGSILGR